MTYQALPSPPAGVFQGEGGSKTDHIGKSVIDPFKFLLFYIPNSVAFIIAWVITMALLQVVAIRLLSFFFPFFFLVSLILG